MEINSLRELLLKKAEDNPYLRTLIEYAREDVLIENVMESLKKMAEPSAAMGRFANSALTAYGGQMDNSDIEQVRDALAHHISHYKGALKSGNRDAADKHLNKIVPLMHLAARASKHSGGKAVLDYRSTTPWETNYTTADRHEHNGKLKEGTKDLGRRPRPARPGSGRSVPNFRYLEMPAHPGHGDTKNLANKGGYPFEEIQFGSPAKRDLGQAYLPIEDVGQVDAFTPHPFDYHPVHTHADRSEDKISGPEKEKFAEELAAWKSGPQHKAWLASQKEKFQKDPEGYKKRGLAKPEHHFTGIQLQEPPQHHKDAAAAMSAPVSAPVAAPTAAAPAAGKSALPDEHFKNLPPELQNKLKGIK